MFTTTLLRRSHAAVPSIVRYGHCNFRSLSTHAAFAIRAGRLARSPSPWPQLRLGLPLASGTVFRLCLSTVPRPSAKRPASGPTYAYPELVNVFLAPSSITAFAGVIRVVTVCFVLAGFTWVAPAMYWDDETPLFMVPAAILGASIPFLMVIASGPVVASIRAHLPRTARASKADLMRFASNVPPNTRITVQYIRVVPWLNTREMYFSELRRLPPSRKRLANMEYVAADERERMSQLGPWIQLATKSIFCRYWISMASKDRSQAKGAWDEMWKQIPLVGSEGDAGGHKKIAGLDRIKIKESRAPAARMMPVERSRAKSGGVR